MPVGRGRLLLAAQEQVSAPPAIPMEKPSFEIASTSEALAQLRLKRREESSQHSSEKKAPTLQEIEAEAAPFEEDVQEAVVEAKTGTCGMNFQFFHSRCCLSHLILIIGCIK